MLDTKKVIIADQQKNNLYIYTSNLFSNFQQSTYIL